jgi:hypothetical protein
MERTGLTRGQRFLAQLQHSHPRHRLLVAAPGQLLGLVDGVLHLLQVGQQQFGFDGADIAHRVHLPSTWVTSSLAKQRTTCRMASTVRMWDRNLLPRPCPSLAPFTRPAMSTSLRAEGRSFPGDVFVDQGQAGIRHRHDAHVGLDGAERIVACLRTGRGQGVKQRALAHIGQADNTSFHARSGLH